jgi:putative phosphoribosyl transferase
LNHRRTAVVCGLILGATTAAIVGFRLARLKYQLKFVSRLAAGQILADLVKNRINRLDVYYEERASDTIVFGIPRGGVIIADRIAKKIGAELRILVVKKIGLPSNRDRAIGSISEDRTLYIDDKSLIKFDVPNGYLQEEISKQFDEVRRMNRIYYGNDLRSYSSIKDKTVIVVDDGADTGSTIIGAVRFLRKFGPRHLIVAIPIAPETTIKMLQRKERIDAIDYIVSPSGSQFRTLSQFYQDYSPITDQQVLSIISEQ